MSSEVNVCISASVIYSVSHISSRLQYIYIYMFLTYINKN